MGYFSCFTILFGRDILFALNKINSHDYYGLRWMLLRMTQYFPSNNKFDKFQTSIWTELRSSDFEVWKSCLQIDLETNSKWF